MEVPHSGQAVQADAHDLTGVTTDGQAYELGA